MVHPSLRASAVAIARNIRAGQWTSREVVDAHIAVIQQVNPTINAMVADRFDRARAEAIEADRRLEREGPEGLPKLHGVPCSIKESFALEGMPNTAGLLARRGVIATHDSVTVARLRREGAIALGVTNTSELCMWLESDNKVYGRTGSAFAPDRTSGGSSGGEGAIVGAGGAPFGLGSDIGGSIRIPAYFNGVFGHKPSGGRVPGSGQYPPAHGESRRMLATGPLTRRAEDLSFVLSLLEGPDDEDTTCEPMPPADPSRVDLSSLRVFVVDEPAPLRATKDLRDTVERAANLLALRGVRVERRSVPGLRRALELWAATLSSAGGPSFAALLGEGRPIRGGIEFIKGLFGRSEYTLPAAGLAFLEKIPALIGTRTEQGVLAARALRASLDELLGDDAVLLFPPHGRRAPKHGTPIWLPVQWGHTAVFNATHHPVTMVPMGLDGDGVPRGVQVVAGHGRDRLSLAVALALEEATGGWEPPAWTLRDAKTN